MEDINISKDRDDHREGPVEGCNKPVINNLNCTDSFTLSDKAEIT